MARTTPTQETYLVERVKEHPEWSLRHLAEDAKKNQADLFRDVSTAALVTRFQRTRAALDHGPAPAKQSSVDVVDGRPLMQMLKVLWDARRCARHISPRSRPRSGSFRQGWTMSPTRSPRTGSSTWS
jgi:hypothetical protein